MTSQVNHLVAGVAGRQKAPPADGVAEASRPTWTGGASRSPKPLSRAQRKARWKQAAIAVLVKGNRVNDVARWYQMSMSRVYLATREFRHVLKFKSRKEKLREKLLPLAKRVRKGEHITQLAQDNHVQRSALSALCRELGIKARVGRPKGSTSAPSKRDLEEDWSLSDRQIAQKRKCSRQAVNQIRQKMVRLGLIPPRPKRRRT